MLSDEVWREIRSRPGLKSKVRGERLYFCCLRHEDNTPSAWTAGGAHGCFSCGFTEPLQSLAQELGILLEGSGGYRLEDYADEKGLPLPDLRRWGLETGEYDGREVVRIPYFDEDHNELRARFRSRTGKWWEGRNRSIYLYGRDHLVDAKEGDPVLVVEGESDCHALWSAGILAVGVPGATSWKSEWAEHLQGLEVYVWEEPDQGGAQMVECIVADFPGARVIRPSGAKDPCELRQQAGAEFASGVQALMREARPHDAPEPPVPFDVLDGDRLERLLEHQLAPVDAVPTPFPGWNRSCRDDGGREGIARGWHVLAAARTGVGKSILALNFAAAAMRHGEAVCFVSLEMSQIQVETRLMAILSGEPIRHLEKGRNFDAEAFSRAGRAFGQVPGVFLTNRRPIHSRADVARSIQAMHEIHGCRYFVVDYIQLAANPNDPESVTEVSHVVRQKAQDLRVITLGLSQFNRSTSSLNESPTVHGLMGSSSLENDAEQIALIDHSTLEPAMKGVDRIGWNAHLLLQKNRHGPTGAIPIHFSSSTLQMRELLDDEIPAHLSEEAAA